MCTKHLNTYKLCLSYRSSLYYPAHLNQLCTDMQLKRTHALLDVVSSQWVVTGNKCVCEGHIFWVCFYVMKAVSKCGFELYSIQHFRIDATVHSIHTTYVNSTFSAHFLRIETDSYNPPLLMFSFKYLGLLDEWCLHLFLKSFFIHFSA